MRWLHPTGMCMSMYVYVCLCMLVYACVCLCMLESGDCRSVLHPASDLCGES